VKYVNTLKKKFFQNPFLPQLPGLPGMVH